MESVEPVQINIYQGNTWLVNELPKFCWWANSATSRRFLGIPFFEIRDGIL